MWILVSKFFAEFNALFADLADSHHGVQFPCACMFCLCGFSFPWNIIYSNYLKPGLSSQITSGNICFYLYGAPKKTT